jgi:alpha-mannosidase
MKTAMNESTLPAKLKNRAALLRCWDMLPLRAILLTGRIWPDDDPAASVPLMLAENGIWGGARQRFELTGSFAAEREAGGTVALILRLGSSASLEKLAFLYGPEALAEIDGEAAFGVDPNHSEWKLSEAAVDGKSHTLRLSGWTGIRDEPYRAGFLGTARIFSGVRELADLADLCLETAEFCENETLAARLYDALDTAFLLLDLAKPPDAAFLASASAALERLKARLRAIPTAPLWRAFTCGHGHLDLAWLWQTDISKGKAARTFSNALRLMEQYPSFCFSQTQAQLYAWMEEEYPRLFKRVLARIRDGRWEVLGGMWVEPDCNITGAESLCGRFAVSTPTRRTDWGRAARRWPGFGHLRLLCTASAASGNAGLRYFANGETDLERV